MERFAQQTAEAAAADKRRRSSSGDKGKKNRSSSSGHDQDPNFGSDFNSGGKKQETMFKTGLTPEVAEEFDESEQPTSPKTWNSIAEAEAELDHHFEKKKQMGFSGFVSAFKGSTKSQKSQRKQGRSSSVPNRRATAPVGSIGELANKPRTPDAKASANPPSFNAPNHTPNYAQKNDPPEVDDNQTLTFKPPRVPSMADEDDYEDFVLEIKCLDTGKTETVDAKTNGLAGISFLERQRIRGSIVLGEKLLQQKIDSFRKGVKSQKDSLARRRGTFSGVGWGKKKNALNVQDDSEDSGRVGSPNGGVGELPKKPDNSELTFTLSNTPYTADKNY
ncbi:hypothetical protein TL16_g05400 [Triparma laevis f. inornata]|uniref:Uncharacterized protein n=2 Tax=Triparma laevis TaxID=1534972 RepID=A0A9W7E5R7_9STRA|nr:hypothetical protein TrLO_g1841 [Triparma laevis f. longispina]GMH70410.1 hypothetical protein TL16_g05400 [Triparma laevis f. inornata]